jgi:predicted amidohydrolase
MDTMTNQSIRISMLHTDPRYDNVLHNIELLEALCLRALQSEPDLIVMPELAISGYEFYEKIGSEWIKDVIPEAIDRFSRFARKHGVALILGCPRFSEKTKKYHNAAIFIDEQGQVVGEHYKINVVYPGSESWASPGSEIRPVAWNGQKIGLLICSDAYTKDISEELAKQGADVLISLAAWAPGFHAPSGEWEQRSTETGLCLIVCNRTGKEKNLEFTGGSSVVVAGGRRLVDYSDKQPAVLSLDVRSSDWFPLSKRFDVLEISESGTSNREEVQGMAAR